MEVSGRLAPLFDGEHELTRDTNRVGTLSFGCIGRKLRRNGVSRSRRVSGFEQIRNRMNRNTKDSESSRRLSSLVFALESFIASKFIRGNDRNRKLLVDRTSAVKVMQAELSNEWKNRPRFRFIPLRSSDRKLCAPSKASREKFIVALAAVVVVVVDGDANK